MQPTIRFQPAVTVSLDLAGWLVDRPVLYISVCAH
jgi:hypothetical protein